MTSKEITDKKLQSCRELIARLRQEPFNEKTEEKLASHAYIHAAEEGSLTLAQKRAFVMEQFAIQKSDAMSFAYLAGHRGFVPNSLSSATVPSDPAIKYPKHKDENVDDLFQFLLGGEIFASSLLLDHAKFVGLGDGGEEAIQSALSAKGGSSPLAQGYPSYWARLALSNQRAAAAAACAVNFPAWGNMCQRLANAHETCNSDKCNKEELEKGLAFIRFFANPIDNLDEMAAAVMAQEEEPISYEAIAEHVRLLQEYELLFWDACYDTK